MFYVYGTDGRIFAGALESLPRNKKIEGGNRSRPGGHEDSPGQQAGSGGEPHPDQAAQPRESEAVLAYRKSIQLEKRIGPLLHADQIMASPVLTADAKDSMDSAWKILKSGNIRHLPIMSREKGGALVGLVTENDFQREHFIPTHKDDRGESPVSSIMRSPVYSADPMTDIRRIAQLMVEKHIGCMPVIGEGGNLIGIITRSDILRGLINHPSFNLWG